MYLSSVETFFLNLYLSVLVYLFVSSKNSKEIWKVIHRIPNPNISTLQVNPSALNEFFNKTAERLVRQNATTYGLLLSHMYLLTSNHDSFKK